MNKINAFLAAKWIIKVGNSLSSEYKWIIGQESTIGILSKHDNVYF